MLSSKKFRKLKTARRICAPLCSCIFTLAFLHVLQSSLSVRRWEQFLPQNNSEPDFCTSGDRTSLNWLRSVYSERFREAHVGCSSLLRVGPRGDGGKMVCLDRLPKHSCVTYSLGSRLDFSFELAVRELLGCEIYTFDCTVGNFSASDIPLGVSFYPWCVGGKEEKKIISSDFGRTGEYGQYYPLDTIMTKLKHKKVDLLKMDIERHEVAVISGLNPDYAPNQVVFETHLHNAYGIWNRPVRHDEWFDMWEKLRVLGYRIFSYEPNPQCPCCCEWSIGRTSS